MIGKNLKYLVTLAACALLPLAGCSGGGSNTSTVTEKGTLLTVNGTVNGVAAAKSLGKTAITANTVEVTNAQDGIVLGSATVAADGSFTGLALTLPSTKAVLVFKATVAQGTFLSLVPIDLSNPPAAGTITGASAIKIVISQESTATAQLVSQLLGLTGDLGDAGQTLTSVNKTYADAAQLVVNNGGQQLAYSGSGLALTGKFSSVALLPAQDANILTGDDLKNLKLTGVVTSVAIPGTKPIVSFQVTNSLTGKGVRGLKSFGLALAQLKPGVNGTPNEWLSYMVTATTRPGTDSGYTVIDNGDGSYTAVFAKDIKGGTGGTVTYDPTYTHRVAVQIYNANTIVLDSRGNTVNPVLSRTTGAVTNSSFSNPIIIGYDFVPNGSVVTEQRDITTTAACNECHTKIGVTTPHGGRIDTKYCVVCHTAQRANGKVNVLSTGGAFVVTEDVRKGDGEVFGEFVTMVHKIHMGSKLSKTGYNYDGVLFNTILYPWGNTVANCRKCHKDGAAAQGNNWQTVPSRKSCGSCHDNIDFATGANSKSGVAGHMTGNHPSQADDSFCVSCHGTAGPYPVDKFHRTNNASTNNPVARTGLVNFTYELNSVTVDGSNNAIIKFRILKDGTAITFNGTSTDPLVGFTSGPSFLFASYKPTGNVKQNAATSIDFNNFGAGAAASTTGASQPKTVSLASIISTQLIPANRDPDGYYTVTVANGFPVGATLRNVGLQGTFTQVGIEAAAGQDMNGDGDKVDNIARQATSVIKAVAGEERRVVVDQVKCLNCHEWISGHGGSRINNPQICVLCHVPNMSSSGKTFNLDYPEATQNMKDMIHSIHAGAFRTTAYTHYRAKGTTSAATSASLYDWSTVKFPGILSNCQMCHKPGTYGAIPAGALVTTDVVTDGLNATVASVFNFRNALELLGTDLVTTPFTAACVSCHDGSAAKAHMTQEGGSILAQRSNAATVESCSVCHAPGRAYNYHK